MHDSKPANLSARKVICFALKCDDQAASWGEDIGAFDGDGEVGSGVDGSEDRREHDAKAEAEPGAPRRNVS